MLSITETFDEFQRIGCCGFATLDGHGGVSSRIAHFFAADEEGLYLRTMTGKPFYRELVEGGQLSVTGERTGAPCSWDEDCMPHFQPGVMMRVSGHVRELTRQEVDAKAAANPQFNVALYDIYKYPETVVFVLDSAWGERYDYDFNMVMRDHKIERERFCWGGASIPEAAFHITDACIACGACAQACTHKAIVAGAPYRILGNRCDECGNCHHACPVGAVAEKGVA